MDTFDRIEALLKEKGMTQADLSRATGISTGLISQWKKRMQSPSAEKLKLVADVFGVTVDYLMNGENKNTPPALTKKYERDIEKILAAAREQLENQEGLMFDGDPASPEAIESILSAMELGLQAAKMRNKEKYTPKKYRQK